jgi:hypothetical protein
VQSSRAMKSHHRDLYATLKRTLNCIEAFSKCSSVQRVYSCLDVMKRSKKGRSNLQPITEGEEEVPSYYDLLSLANSKSKRRSEVLVTRGRASSNSYVTAVPHAQRTTDCTL